MPQNSWRSNFALGGWVIAAILACILFADVVAVGSNPSAVKDNAEANQRHTQESGANHRPRRKTLDPAEYEEYCKDGANSKDCIVQLRTAEATESQAFYAWLGLLLAGPTIFLTALGLLLVRQTLIANRKAADEAARAAAAASQANQLSRELFVATERPWVKVTVAIGGPLTYDVNGLSVTLLFRVTNVGRSPAVNVWIDSRIYTFTGEPINPIALQQQHLAEIRGRPHLNWGFMLFPGETKSQSHTVSISKETLDKAKQLASFVMPTVEGFVSYRFVFDRVVRVTSFSVLVQRKDMPRPATDKEKRSPTAIFFDDDNMPAEHLGLVWAPLSEEYAD